MAFKQQQFWRPLRIGLPTLLFLAVVWSVTAQGQERQVIRDNRFRHGFVLWEPKPGNHVEYGRMAGPDTNSAPVWGLAQWSSQHRLDASPRKQGPSLIFSNAAKSISFALPEADLAFAANSAVEYGPASRRAGEPWVHLLAEQDFVQPPFLQSLAAAKFHIEARLQRSTNLHRGDYESSAHAAQFQVFFTVQNRNRQSPGFGDYLWFGIPIYDSRHRHPPEFKSGDFGGTEKFIFTPAGTVYTAASAHDGEWIEIESDLLPLMRAAVEAAWAKGFLAGSTNLADYAIGGMNLGWELPGLFDVEMAIRNLSLTAVASRKTLPVPGETLIVEGRDAFLIAAAEPAPGKPWVWYAPTLPAYPASEERWMFEHFLAAGISIAGIDVGESYGSPAGRKLYSALYEEMRRRGYSAKPVLLGRSRGGLMTLSWAAENPEKVGGFAGIYPVCNLASYPGIAKAAPAYELSPEKLGARLAEHNPIDRLGPLAKAGVPLFAIHGDVDALVPLKQNSEVVRGRYAALGGEMRLIIPPGQGHNMWTGFFQSEELVEFVRANAR